TPTSGNVAIIDRILADRCFPAEDPIGKWLVYGSTNARPPQPRRWEIVGVVAPIKNSRLEAPMAKETIYFSTQGSNLSSLSLVMRPVGPPMQLAAPLRAAMRALDPEQPINALRAMGERIESSIERRRTPMILLALFAAIGLVLATVGVYGVLAF